MKAMEKKWKDIMPLPKNPCHKLIVNLVLVMWARKRDFYTSNISRLLDSNTYVNLNMISEETIEICQRYKINNP